MGLVRVEHNSVASNLRVSMTVYNLAIRPLQSEFDWHAWHVEPHLTDILQTNEDSVLPRVGIDCNDQSIHFLAPCHLIKSLSRAEFQKLQRAVVRVDRPTAGRTRRIEFRFDQHTLLGTRK